jgi:hypothetical protein
MYSYIQYAAAMATRTRAGAVRVAAEIGVVAGVDADGDGEAADPGAEVDPVPDPDTGADTLDAVALGAAEVVALEASEPDGVAGTAELEEIAEDGPLSTGATLPSIVVAPFVDTQIGGPWTPASSLTLAGGALMSSGRVASILADAAARSAGVSSGLLIIAHLQSRGSAWLFRRKEVSWTKE